MSMTPEERTRPISLRFAREALAEKNLLKERKHD
jgi:hypothetical protein